MQLEPIPAFLSLTGIILISFYALFRGRLILPADITRHHLKQGSCESYGGYGEVTPLSSLFP